nr:MAG TPA: hypothetical protein [Caudoviricetes sp.]
MQNKLLPTLILFPRLECIILQCKQDMSIFRYHADSTIT